MFRKSLLILLVGASLVIASLTVVILYILFSNMVCGNLFMMRVPEKKDFVIRNY